MGPEACVRVLQAIAAGNPPNPRDVEDCERWRQIMESIRQFYLIKFFPPPFPPPGPIRGIPDLGQFFGDPSPQPNVFGRSGIQDLLFAELFLDVLRRDPTPTPTVFSQIRESGAQLEVVKGLLKQFDEATKILKKELDNLEKGCKG
jgi:hypothetical protein